MPAHVVQAKGRLVGVLVAQLATAVQAVADYHEAVRDFFARLPAGNGVMVSTIWAELGDSADRWTPRQQLLGHRGVVPVTVRSRKHQRSQFRFACERHLRSALTCSHSTRSGEASGRARTTTASAGASTDTTRHSGRLRPSG